MIKVQLFSGANGVRTLAPAWRQLTARLPLKRHFHHVEWYLALAETFERHNLPPLQCISVFSNGDNLVAVFPFRFVRAQIGSIQLNALRLASDQIDADTARDFILAAGLAETSFFQGFVKYMSEHDAAWDVMILPGILETSLAATALKWSSLPVLQTPGGAWGRIEIVSCGDDDRPFERLSKGFRQNLRTAHNKLKSAQIEFACANTHESLVRLLPEFLKVESSGWKGEMGTSALKQPHTGTFLRQLIAHFGPNGNCEIHLMYQDGAPIAALFGIVSDKIWYIFRIGYDEKFHRASPGHLIVENLLKQRNTNPSFDQITPYNAPPWFSAWKPDRVLQILNAYVFRPSPKGVELAKSVGMILHQPARQA
jgi:CelD/BcsL family acetyltransferase involved in cellulose biosynthesis